MHIKLYIILACCYNSWEESKTMLLSLRDVTRFQFGKMFLYPSTARTKLTEFASFSICFVISMQGENGGHQCYFQRKLIIIITTLGGHYPRLCFNNIDSVIVHWLFNLPYCKMKEFLADLTKCVVSYKVVGFHSAEYEYAYVYTYDYISWLMTYGEKLLFWTNWCITSITTDNLSKITISQSRSLVSLVIYIYIYILIFGSVKTYHYEKIAC